MGVCCCDRGGESEDLLRIRVNPGPKVQRRCTDPLCCLLFLVVLVASCGLLAVLWQLGDVRRIDHGRDHEGNLCGLAPQEARPLLFYPDLDTDFKKDPLLQGRYGVCVATCPEVGSVVLDYGTPRQAEWLVLQPSFPVFQRCVPYQEPKVKVSTTLCVSPGCQATATTPSSPQQVCGLQADGSDKFWLLEAPAASIQNGWRAEGASEALVQARSAVAAGAPQVAGSCKQRVKREAQVSIKPLDACLRLRRHSNPMNIHQKPIKNL